ncbi:DUF2188 domain-containing protein [Reichenbachiella sp.]|uniref:DUF2188 domain-containing protein n=1 Tax=Reichenbachiella sp. TaxID=2184521 RepID=UPI003BB12C66
MKKNIHVLTSSNGNWAVKKEGALLASKIASTQKDAIRQARELAIANKSEMLVHGIDGKIRQKNSYGNDSFPPKG